MPSFRYPEAVSLRDRSDEVNASDEDVVGAYAIASHGTPDCTPSQEVTLLQ